MSEVENREVVDLIRKRLTSPTVGGGQLPKLGLVIEGGGMRSCVGAGMALALEEMGALSCFDGIYASSGGAITAAYFAAAQTRLGLSLFTEELTNPAFMNWRRVARGRPYMSMDFLLDEVIAERKKLDVAAVSRAPFTVIATAVANGQPTVLTPFDHDHEVFAALRATCTIPFISGRAAEYRNELYFDGGFHESVPFRAAVDDGCTHVLIAVTRPWSARRARPTVVHRLLARRIRRHYGLMADAFLSRLKSYPADLEYLERITGNSEGPVKFCAVAPKGPVVNAFERRRGRLQQGIDQGYLAMKTALGY